jgi:hypothetical protein
MYNGKWVENRIETKKKIWIKTTIQGIKPWKIIHGKTTKFTVVVCNIYYRKYMHAETVALLTKPLYFPNMKYLK